MTIKGLNDRVKKMNIDAIIDQAFDETLPALEDINRERMNDGVRSDGTMMPNYSPASVKYFGYPPGPIKLKATGAFQGGILAKRSGNILSTESVDPKSKMLQGKYGPEIFGTGGEYKNEYISKNLRPALHKGINLVTGLKFGK